MHNEEGNSTDLMSCFERINLASEVPGVWGALRQCCLTIHPNGLPRGLGKQAQII